MFGQYRKILCSRLVLVLQFCFYVQHTNEDICFCRTFIDRCINLAILTKEEDFYSNYKNDNLTQIDDSLLSDHKDVKYILYSV